jgi:outer membrane protein assembly factor BamB
MKVIQGVACAAVMGAVSFVGAPEAAAGAFNMPGNILIADQFNNRVIEVDPAGQIVWSFGLGPHDFSAKSVVGTNDAERVGRNTLIAGSGLPPGIDPYCLAGCMDNRVLLVDPNGRIVWQYGKFKVAGSGSDELNTPVQATWTPLRTVFITDQGNARVIEVSVKTKKILWQYGQTGVTGNGPDQLNNPNSAELLDNGHILIADENNNRVIEVNRKKNIVATFTAGGTVSGAAFASRLPNGDTLIGDSNNSRAVEVDKKDTVVWQYYTNKQSGSVSMPQPTHAVRTETGRVLISDQINNRVILVDKKSMKIIVQYGNLPKPGYGTTSTKQGIDWPYDAKVIGDYTGLTPPY